MKYLSKAGDGFTLIELVIVIAIIGILSAVAIPKFIDLTSNAKIAATTAIAGALSSSSSSNHLARKVDIALGSTVVNCTDVSALLEGGLPSGYTITSASIAADVTTTCTVTAPGGTSLNPAPSATFTATGVA